MRIKIVFLIFILGETYLLRAEQRRWRPLLIYIHGNVTAADKSFDTGRSAAVLFGSDVYSTITKHAHLLFSLNNEYIQFLIFEMYKKTVF